MSNSSLFTPALLRTHSFVFFAVHETHRIFLSPFISKASRCVSSFFLSVQLSQPYIATGHTSAFISRIFRHSSLPWSCQRWWVGCINDGPKNTFHKCSIITGTSDTQAHSCTSSKSTKSFMQIHTWQIFLGSSLKWKKKKQAGDKTDLLVETQTDTQKISDHT